MGAAAAMGPATTGATMSSAQPHPVRDAAIVTTPLEPALRQGRR
jgi:hypothetical protein